MDLAPQVKDMTEAVQNLPSLLSAVLALVTTPGGTIVIILFLLWLLVNSGGFSRAFDMLERKERRRLEQINEYVSSHDSADPETIKAVRDLRDAHYFNVATDIYAENRTRSAFIKAHQAYSHCISWKHIQRARPYIEIAADETITIRDLTLFERLGYWYNQFVAYGSFVLSVVLFLTTFVLSDHKNMMSFVVSFGSSILLVVFAFFVFFQNLPIDAKERIAKELK